MIVRRIQSATRGLLQIIVAVPLSALALSPSQVFEQVKDSVVVVRVLDVQGKPKSQGSGVMLPSGQIATNCHVVEDSVRFQVRRDNRFVAGQLRPSDGNKDLCLIEAQGLSVKPAVLGKAAVLKVGEAVYAVGSPQGLELSLSNGIVSQLRGGPPPFIQTTAAISPGSSGGGLFDGEGRLVGITTFYLEGGQSLNFALPVEWLAEITPGTRKTTAGRSLVDWLVRVGTLERKKDWLGLINWSRQWTDVDPGNALSWVILGTAYLNARRHTEAIEALRRALSLRRDETAEWIPGTWNTLGVAYTGVQRNSEAIEAFRQALRLRRDDADTWYNVGVANGKLQRHNEAINAYREALRLRPDHPRAWANLGINYDALGRHNDAINAYREALRLEPDDPALWYDLGRTDGQVPRPNEAIAAFRQALRLRPDHVDSWFGLAVSNAMAGNRPAAMEAMATLRRYDPAKADEVLDLLMSK